MNLFNAIMAKCRLDRFLTSKQATVLTDNVLLFLNAKSYKQVTCAKSRSSYWIIELIVFAIRGLSLATLV